jgi:membrane protein insertase Oxa1/YidC/SpoIIIJ
MSNTEIYAISIKVRPYQKKYKSEKRINEQLSVENVYYKFGVLPPSTGKLIPLI